MNLIQPLKNRVRMLRRIQLDMILKDWSELEASWTSQVTLVKNLPADVGDEKDTDSIPEPDRSPRGGHSNTLQYSCLENPMDRGAWRAAVHRGAKTWTLLRWLSIQMQRLLSCCWLVVKSSFFCYPMDCSPPDSSVYGISQVRITGVGCHFLLQGIFLTQGLNLPLVGLLHWQPDSLPLS